ncbi:MAG TPA: hypothetical protein VFH68_15430 [Polyangia bacterium]|nr:hypothetical protein [Polyangia bacterium]
MLKAKPPITYASLAPRQRQLLAEKRVSDRMGARAWLDLLAPLARFDTAADRARLAAGRGTFGGVMVTFFGLFAIGAAHGALWSLFVPAAGVALAIRSGLRYRRLGKLDLSNNLARVVVPFLTVLHEEGGPDRPVGLDLDLRAGDIDEKLQETLDLPPARGALSIVERRFRDPWMTGTAELAGGAKLSWTVVDDVREQKRRRRSASGKTKTKTKYKKRSLITVGVSFPARRFAVAAAPAEAAASKDLRVESSAKGQTFELRRAVKVASLEPLDVSDLLDLVAVAFRRATPVAKGAPRT